MTAEALKEGFKVILYNDRIYNNYELKGRIYPKEGYYSLLKDFENAMTYLQNKH